ncbi:hypothetical protein [Microbispora sp. KK1-11]|uniref:hypothetical protein n=1 Tax=Microbispora sp. KK1-11 TaxID=2053005 RepID=UPI001158DA82|nr:hypothetical protein [Microbispora sp. KK1-11]TQS24943.1 hypothetical protein FLW16_33430 [Microbispora sp. KK1-11]
MAGAAVARGPLEVEGLRVSLDGFEKRRVGKRERVAVVQGEPCGAQQHAGETFLLVVASKHRERPRSKIQGLDEPGQFI